MVIKKGNIILTAITAVLIIFLMFLIFRGEKTNPVFSTPLAGKVIVIDPGHGGFDAGASAQNISEKGINLEIALLLKGFIEENGGVAVLTRSRDESTADPNRPKTMSQKKSDLLMRRNLPKKCGADIFISIHLNKFSDPKYKGAQVFCAPDSKESEDLGKLLQAALIKNADPENNREIKIGKSIFILKDPSVPSALIECGFLSNPNEAEKLTTTAYQKKIAWAIFLGISEYFTK